MSAEAGEDGLMPGRCDDMARDGTLWDRISIRRAKAISALAGGETVYEASLSAGHRSKATLYRWLRKPNFRATPARPGGAAAAVRGVFPG